MFDKMKSVFVFSSVWWWLGIFTSGAMLTNGGNMSEDVFRLTILHTNDMHSRFEQTNSMSGKCSTQDAEAKKCFGGFARLRTAVRTTKAGSEADGRKVLFLNAGDTFQGTPYYNLFKWDIAAQFIEMLGIDAMALGNHEFDDGPEGLAPYLKNITIPNLACNLDLTDQPSMNVSTLINSMIFNFSDFKIGVVGYLTPDTKILSKPGGVRFLPEIPNVQRETDQLREKGANIVIALGHSGFDVDLEIAKNVKGIDLVIGGHTNTFLYNGKQPSTEEIIGPYPTTVTQEGGKKVLVVQAYAYTKYLGVLNLDFTRSGSLISYHGNPILLDSSIKEDDEVLQALRPRKAIIDKRNMQRIGVTKVLLDGSETVRRGESNLGNFITDAFVDYYVRKYTKPENAGVGWTDSPIGITQGGSIRSSIDVASSGGNVTYIDLLTSMPFDDLLTRIVVKGRCLLDALEWGVRNIHNKSTNFDGAFLHVSGLQIEYDMLKKPGERIVKALARCSDCPVPEYAPIEDDNEYAILLSSYLAEGGDGFDMFKYNRSSISLLPETDTTIVMDYLKRNSPIYPGKEGRIITKHFNRETHQHSDSAEDPRSSATRLFISHLCTFLTVLLSGVLLCS